MKLLTVTVPCYNSQNYMENCLNSLLAGGDRVEISRSSYTTKLVQLAHRNFYQVINQKLGGFAP